MQPSAICVWGDSIAKGVYFDETRNRYAILRENCLRLLEQELHLPVYNHGAMGRTAPECLAAMEKSDLIPGGLAVIEFGGNDSDLCWAEVAKAPENDHPARSSMPQFRESLRGMIRFAREGKMTPVLMTPLPLDGERYFRWVSRGLDDRAILSYLGDAQMMCRWQERYACAVRDVAHEEGVPLLDFREDFLSDRGFLRLYCRDGIHPNALGHQKLFRCAMQAAAQWKS